MLATILSLIAKVPLIRATNVWKDLKPDSQDAFNSCNANGLSDCKRRDLADPPLATLGEPSNSSPSHNENGRVLSEITGPARVQPLDPASKEEHTAKPLLLIPAVPNQAASRHTDQAVTFQEKRRRLQATPLYPKRNSTCFTQTPINGADKWDVNIDQEAPLSVEIYPMDADDSDGFDEFFAQPITAIGIGDASNNPEQPPPVADQLEDKERRQPSAPILSGCETRPSTQHPHNANAGIGESVVHINDFDTFLAKRRRYFSTPLCASVMPSSNVCTTGHVSGTNAPT